MASNKEPGKPPTLHSPSSIFLISPCTFLHFLPSKHENTSVLFISIITSGNYSLFSIHSSIDS